MAASLVDAGECRPEGSAEEQLVDERGCESARLAQGDALRGNDNQKPKFGN